MALDFALDFEEKNRNDSQDENTAHFKIQKCPF